MPKEQKVRRIKPKYIKDQKGKTTQVYLDIETYDAVLKRLKEFDQIKKQTSGTN